jgi:uncharacterized protein YcfJ
MTDKTSLNGSFDNDLNTHSVRSSVLQAVALFTGLSVCSMSAFADTSVQRANVVSSSPVYETVVYEEPREVCRQERVAYQEPVRESKTAGVVGALIGGALGNALHHWSRHWSPSSRKPENRSNLPPAGSV